MRKFLILFLVALICSNHAFAQRLSPYQSGAYYPGLINLRDYAAAPAGIALMDYNYWLHSLAYFDKNGDKFTGGEVALPSPDDPVYIGFDPRISGYMNAPGLFYASDFKLFGAQYQASVSPIFLNLDYKVFMSLNDDSQEIKGNISGWGDLTVMPVALVWSFDNISDVGFSYTFYAPTGRYENGADDNLGQGYWTHQLQFPAYYYAMEQATALAIIPTFEFNGDIKDTDTRAGNRFSLEYGISQYFTEHFSIELINGHNWQLSEDKGKEAWWDNTILDSKDRKNTFSAGIGLLALNGKLNVNLKYIIDYGVRQRFKDEFLSFNVVFLPGVLTGKSQE